MAPFSWNGAEFIYHRFIAPFVLKHEKEVDKYLSKGEQMAKEFYGKGTTRIHCRKPIISLGLVSVESLCITWHFYG